MFVLFNSILMWKQNINLTSLQLNRMWFPPLFSYAYVSRGISLGRGAYMLFVTGIIYCYGHRCLQTTIHFLDQNLLKNKTFGASQIVATVCGPPKGGEALNFFSGRGVWPRFLKCGACELIFASEKGAGELKISKFGSLWTEIIQIWGLVSWKFPNLGACELKFGQKLRL